MAMLHVVYSTAETPEEERMVKRSGIRQYIKDKPTKWGIKLLLLADSSSGYTIYTYVGRAAV